MNPLARDNYDIDWLKDNSMLTQAKKLIREYIRGDITLGSSSSPKGEEVIDQVSTWLSIYPNAVVTSPGKRVLATLGDFLEHGFPKSVGIKGIYLTPINLAGGVEGPRNYTPSTDGNFDPISIEIDPALGTSLEYKRIVDLLKEQQRLDNTGDDEKQKTPIIRNLVPLHTGQGPDFLLALFGEPEYQNIYMMVEIRPEDWGDCLPSVDEFSGPNDPVPTAPVSREQAEKLAKKGYIPGLIHSADAALDASQQTGWSATSEITGRDNDKKARCIYMHYFKPSQPALNPDHPDCQALTLINGIVIDKIKRGHACGLRLDAVPFSIEKQPDTLEIWDYYTPSAVRKASQFASLIRQLGSFSFQELMAPLQDVKQFMLYGTDLTYDFFTRAPYLHAILTGDAALLRLAFRWLLEAGIQPKSLVHDLQNHDELTYQLPELVHRRDEPFTINGTTMSGNQLHEKILQEMREKAIGKGVFWWNRLYRSQWDGVATTMVGFIAAALRIKDPYNATADEKEKIKKAHLLVAMANAMQPGVFSLSAWDLVGALPLTQIPKALRERFGESDLRWFNRGAVDLLGVNPDVRRLDWGLPCAKTLYGPLNKQLGDPTSFASRLKQMLDARERHKIAYGKLKSPPPYPKHPGVCLLALQLPEKEKMPGRLQLAVTALNFGDNPAEEVLIFSELFGYEVNSVRNWQIIDAVTDAKDRSLLRTGRMTIELDERAGKTILIQQR